MPTISRPPPVLGFGIRLDNAELQDDMFPCALDPDFSEEESESRMPILTLREIRMLQFMNQVTDKDEWEAKVFDEEITHKWKMEATGTLEADFTPEMAEYCIEELKYKAEIFKETGYVHVYNGDVVKSDSAIPTDLRNALKKAVSPLEDVPAEQLDWHPGSNNQVLDLVHPSLCPLVYGLSRILPDRTVGLEDCMSHCGEGEVIPQPSEDLGLVNFGPSQKYRAYSRRFQWLPCDVDIAGETPRIVSYINNLHPQLRQGLYRIIEKVIEKVIPLWNASLSSLLSMDWPRRIQYGVDVGVEYENGNVVQPNPQPFSREDFEREDDDSESSGVDLKEEYADTGLQVIVKLASIHLSPDKPTYNGGTWHVEGQLDVENEHICATAIYYYDVENITPSHLAFRQASDTREVEEEVPYEQNDWAWVEPIFGLRTDEPAIQPVGSVLAREGRVVTFPNLLQHRVQPFELADPTKPGHRKILALFLVDPHVRVISTANIPCQQREWWTKSINESGEGHDEFPIGSEKAKAAERGTHGREKAVCDRISR
ncbi:hypothetical protein NP233_g9195 [Leucocoprinus birnbaumii]|uniref:Uncharacterized protein n=1 Tax=Leucocoprinus birnbaumii TaxID=56174 RepID=A0AAD5VNB6_9AGAR|nr:hypothetical protein NP233_g9195 [Leucocoprinus birnbaumii]